MHNRNDVGVRVKLIGWNSIGILVEPGVFRADHYTNGLHDGNGRGEWGHYWFVMDDSIEYIGPAVRKKSGFSKFIQRIEAHAGIYEVPTR